MSQDAPITDEFKLSDYQQNIKHLSDEIVKAQAPIRILDSIKWDISVKEKFFAKKFKEQPEVTQEYYQKNTSLDWSKQRQLFHIIEREV
ncbi:MAG TPA: hypothetical protein PLD88_10925, partial [Candidatus Berkiella sp.]|nr:hypothetical protein [Candidatus Berkiella sp.]